MSKLDPRIEAIRAKYDLDASDFWELPQKKGTWVCKHAALEVVAVKADIKWAMPQIIEADGANGVAAMVVAGTMGTRTEWATGEASSKNNKNAYPWAMAEKRAKDRVVLKLSGIHGLVYSEDEMSDEPQRTTQVIQQQTEQPKPEVKRLSKDASRSSFSEVSEAFRTAETLDALDAAGKRYKPKINEMHADFEEDLKGLFKSFRADIISREQEKHRTPSGFKSVAPNFNDLQPNDIRE